MKNLGYCIALMQTSYNFLSYHVWKIIKKNDINFSKMDLDSRGQFIKLIPSLNGRLYKFNGEVVEPIPMNVDSLLGEYHTYCSAHNK